MNKDQLKGIIVEADNLAIDLADRVLQYNEQAQTLPKFVAEGIEAIRQKLMEALL